MSYRLIDSNALAMSCAEVNDLPCIYADLPNGLDGGHYTMTDGGGECEWELEHSGTLYDKWRCSECKFLFVEPRCDQGYTDLVPNFCPNCGKAVKR